MKIGDHVKILCEHQDWEGSFGVIVPKKDRYGVGQYRVKMTIFPKYPQYLGHEYNFLPDEIETTQITVEELQTDYSID